MGFWMGLLQGAIGSGVSAVMSGKGQQDSGVMSELDTFLSGLENETKSQASSNFEFSDLDSGDNLGDLLVQADERSQADKDLALFTGQADSKKKFKKLGDKISKGQSLGLFDFI